MKAIQTTKRALRRLLLEKQLLLSPRREASSSGQALRECVLDVIGQLACVQIDPVAAVRPNQHLVLAARITGYEPEALNSLLRENEVFEYLANAACVIPMANYAMFQPVRERISVRLQDQIELIRPIVDQVLQKLGHEGPLPAKAFQSQHRVSGYWDNNDNATTKATSHALNLLTDAAHIRIVGREGNQRLFDLSARSVPLEQRLRAEGMEQHEARELLLRHYFRAYTVFEPGDPRLGWQRLNAKERREAIHRYVQSGEAAAVEVEGLKMPYYILSSDMEQLAAHQREDEKQFINDDEDDDRQIRFLPPLDNLLWSRKRLEDLFEFQYRWEIYTPAVKRKYGYYAMPILAGDRLIGRMDPRLDNKRKHMSVQLLQIDPVIDYTESLRFLVQRELEAFARAHGADTVTIERFLHRE